MNSITQDMSHRLSLIKYSWKYGVTKVSLNKEATKDQYRNSFPQTKKLQIN